MKKLVDFLTDLATNPRQQSAFAMQPTAVMKAFGLSDTEQAILTSGSHVQISAAAAEKTFQSAGLFADPNPDPWPDPDPPMPDEDPPIPDEDPPIPEQNPPIPHDAGILGMGV